MRSCFALLFWAMTLCNLSYSQTSFLKVYQAYGDTAKIYEASSEIAGVAYSPFYPEDIFLLVYESGSRINGTLPEKDVLSLIKIDTFGNLLATHNYYTGTIGQGKYSISIDDAGDILIGARYHSPVSLGDALYLRVDTAGNILTSKIYGSWDNNSVGDDYGIYSIKALPTGGNSDEVYIAGGMSIAANLNTCQNPFLEKINKTTGLVQWHHEIQIPGCEPAEDLFLYPNQDIGLVVKSLSPGLISLITLTKAGSLVNMPVGYSFDSSVYSAWDLVHIFTSANNHFVAGILNNSMQNDSAVFAFMTDVNHNVIWKKKYKLNVSVLYAKIAATEGSDGYLYIAAGTETATSKKDGLLFMKVNPNSGNIEWSRHMGANVSGNPYILTQASRIIEINHSFYIIGNRNSGGGRPFYILKCDKNGNWGDDRNDNRSINVTTDSLPGILVTPQAFYSDLTYGIGNVNIPDSLFLFDVIRYGGPPLLNVHAEPNPICNFTLVHIIDSSLNVNSWNTRIFDSYWGVLGQSLSYYSNNDYENDSIWYYGGDNVNPNHWFDKEDSYCYDSVLIVVKVAPMVFSPGFTYNANQFNVQFTDTTRVAVQWQWDFGDGDSSTVRNPLHTYASPGTYNVCLTAWSPCDSSTICQPLTITGTGISGGEKGRILTGPNPVHDNLRIVNPGGGNVELCIYDAAMRKLAAYGPMNGHIFRVDMSLFPKGIYFIQIKKAGDSILSNKKIIKM